MVSPGPDTTMRPLRPTSLRAYRARVTRSALVRVAVRTVAGRRLALSGALAAALLLTAPGVLPGEDGVQPAIALAAPRPAPAPAVPRIARETGPGGPAHAYVSRAHAATADAPPSPLAVSTIADAWSAAFFGDRERVTAYIADAALAHDLPAEFLLHLLKQESGLNHQAVSRAGALGIAQFMPATAGERGLVDPFDPFEAIPKSAELLREFRTQFGNLGLAAAAYNAGPRRVRDWLAGRSSLPAETRNYVVRITGRTIEEWRVRGDLVGFADPMPRRGS
ncbi:Lytic transglycosylase catalytic [Methylobacterium sp. 4-46]|uniref:lytic transglycosylase domain-containing protein n=1 Tax=unclassified Methylobacterium TaxID=2615210 RepID=UPI000152D9F7|nr:MULTISPECIES: lytic transglycosylase domain-containing protein [Methylobacterium]ACA17416.1 Lytic transglycosylase catalytic [Methylobacterium sp. 4-46]WFT83100.1 lytic transglycosylase domain-containing protein [Methylobacterium nodulans]